MRAQTSHAPLPAARGAVQAADAALSTAQQQLAALEPPPFPMIDPTDPRAYDAQQAAQQAAQRYRFQQHALQEQVQTLTAQRIACLQTLSELESQVRRLQQELAFWQDDPHWGLVEEVTALRQQAQALLAQAAQVEQTPVRMITMLHRQLTELTGEEGPEEDT